jgi:tripartite-type tricarboxylate transporter receptor subunit TctC
MASAVPYIRSARLRPIAVTSARRSKAAPQVPTLAESGAAGYDFASEWGLLLPAKVPAEVLQKFSGELARILRMPDVVEKLESQGAEVTALAPDEYAAAIRAGLAKWDKVIKAAEVRAD